ncbi:MAG: hypothetical protein QXN63_05790 [Candidatus Bathyarchaeia archaeon]
MVMQLGTVTIKVDEVLRQKMREIKINWSEYIREAIKRRVEVEEKRKAAEKLLESLKAKRHVVPSGFINETIREMRDAR